MLITNDKNFLQYLKKHPEHFFIIHYSCQSLSDNPEGLSSKITSIAITNYNSEQTISFSTHAIAEELGIERKNVRKHFDAVELEMLRRFYDFIRDHRDKFWVHWNMRNLTYGFEHFEHRYRVLGGKDTAIISVERRINLNDMLKSRYGDGYAKHGRLYSLLKMNGETRRGFLTGEEEAQAFEDNEFSRLHQSTLAKVGFFWEVMGKMADGTLQTSSRRWATTLDRIYETRPKRTISLIWSSVSLVYFVIKIYDIFK